MRRVLRHAREVHRVLGVALCAMFAVWFASGIVMTFVGFPSVTGAERRARAKPLAQAGPLPPPASFSELAAPAALRMLGERAVYFVQDAHEVRTLWADTGARLRNLDARAARAVAGSGARLVETLDEVDTWTPWFTGPLPMYRYRLDDVDGTESYVAAATGLEVQRSTRSERWLAWLGAIPHWIYLAELRRHRGAWRSIVLALSAAGCLVCLTGLVRGLSILRRRRRQWLPRSPVKDPELRWHHVLGLAFGLLAFTWTFSGMLSLSPFAWNQRGHPTDAQAQAFAGGAWRVRDFTLAPQRAVATCDQELITHELRLTRVLGHSYYVCLDAGQASRLVPAGASVASAKAQRRLSFSTLRAAAAAVLGGPPEHDGLRFAGDDYLYATHSSDPLPTSYYRATRGDRQVYIDPSRGELLKVSTPASRWTRWLYNGLHSWDFAPLYRHRTVWRTTVIVAMLVGLALSISAMRLSMRLWRRRRARRLRAAERSKRVTPKAARSDRSRSLDPQR